MNKLQRLLCVTGLSILTGCSIPKPELNEIRDFNNDGIPDVLIDIQTRDYDNTWTWLFLSQKDGSYIKAMYNREEGHFETGIKTDDGELVFFWDKNSILKGYYKIYK